MFPPKREPPKPPTFYARHKVSIGIQLVVDQVWRYVLQSAEQLTVQIRKPDDTVVLEKVFTSSDVDPDDKIINVTFSSDEMDIADGLYFLCAFVDDYVVINAHPITVRKVVSL